MKSSFVFDTSKSVITMPVLMGKKIVKDLNKLDRIEAINKELDSIIFNLNVSLIAKDSVNSRLKNNLELMVKNYSLEKDKFEAKNQESIIWNRKHDDMVVKYNDLGKEFKKYKVKSKVLNGILGASVVVTTYLLIKK